MSAVLTEDVTIAFASAERNNLRAEIVLSETVSAPVSEGDIVGRLEVSNGDTLIGEYPVSAATSVSRAGLLARAIEGLSQKILPQ